LLKKNSVGAAVLLLTASAVLAGCGGSSEDEGGGGGGGEELQKVDLALSTSSLFGYGYWMAQELGYYEDEGLDVTLQATGGSSDVAGLLASNQVPAGMGVPGAMLPAMEQGANLYPFFTYAYGEVFDVVVPAGSDIASMEDLEGMRIGITATTGGEAPLLRALLVDAGMDPETDVEIVAVGEATPNIKLSLEQEKIDAFAGPKSAISTFNAVGLDVESIAPESLDTLPAEGLVASEESKDDDELLIALARATAKGQLAAYTNPDGAACVLMEVLPEEFSDPEAGRDSLAGVMEVTTAPKGDDGEYEFGYLDAEGWETYVDIFQQSETIKTDVPVADLVVTDLLPEINDFDRESITTEAEELPTDC
jgi:NitT/TauT family transport system substrate-binding protein